MCRAATDEQLVLQKRVDERFWSCVDREGDAVREHRLVSERSADREQFQLDTKTGEVRINEPFVRRAHRQDTETGESLDGHDLAGEEIDDRLKHDRQLVGIVEHTVESGRRASIRATASG